PKVSTSSGHGAASVRMAALSRAERARGFTSNSPLEGVNGRELISRKLGGTDFIDSCGICRETDTVLPDRSAKNFLTIRSSRLWNEATHKRPPGLRQCSAADNP